MDNKQKLLRLLKLEDILREGDTAIARFLFNLEDNLEQAKNELESYTNQIAEQLQKTDNQLREEFEDIKPTDERLVEIIQPLIPEVADGKTPSKEELLELIRPLIPQVKDGKSPSKQELLELIKPLIPQVNEDDIISRCVAIVEENIKLPDTEEIVKESIEKIEKNIPQLGQPIRDSLELLQDNDRLDISSIRGLDNYDEIVDLAKQERKIVKKYYNNGGGLPIWGDITGNLTDQTDLTTYISNQLATQDTLQEVTDLGSTTTNDITANSFITDGGDNTEVVLGDGTLKPLSDIQTLPAGSDTEIQFNDGGAFGASSNLKWNDKLEVLGEEVDLSGTGVTGATLNIVTPGSKITSVLTTSVNWTFRITPYKKVGGIYYYYEPVETNTAMYDGALNTAYDVNVSWDAFVGADGYIVQQRTERVSPLTLWDGYAPPYLRYGWYDVGTNTTFSAIRLLQATDTPGFFYNIFLDIFANQTYIDTAIQSSGALNLINGNIQVNGEDILSKTDQNGLDFGKNAVNGTSLAFGLRNKIGSFNQVGGLVIGTDNIFLNNISTVVGTNNVNSFIGSIFTGSFVSVFGNNNILNTQNITVIGNTNNATQNGTVIGNTNINTARGTIIGNSNTVSHTDSIILGDFLSTFTDSLQIGYGSATLNPPNNLIITRTGGRLGTFVDSPSRDIELNKNVIIENLSNRGSNLLKNGRCVVSSGNWTLGVGWTTIAPFAFFKDSDGTGTLTPLFNPIQAGKRYVLYINFLNEKNDSSLGFTGSATITAGGVTLGSVSRAGTKFITFDSINTNGLVITPTNTSRFGVSIVELYELTNGDLETVGSGFFGEKQYFIKQDGTSRVGDLIVDDSTRGVEKISNGNFFAYSTTASPITADFWSFTTGWTYNIAGEEARKSANGTGALFQVPAGMKSQFVIGETYELIYTVTSWTVGTVTPSVAGVTLTARGANGTYTQQFTAVSNTQLNFTPTNTARFYIKNVSIKRVNSPRIRLGIGGTINTELLSDGSASFKGSLTLGYRAITALRTLDATDYTVDCTANSFTVTLPTAIGITGRIYNIKNSGVGIITVDATASIGGDSTTRFDITKPTASVARYTFDGTGTNPNISSVTIPVGTWLDIQGQNFNAANKGIFQVTASTTNYFEITNAAGIAENDKTLGTGFINFNQRIDGQSTQTLSQYDALTVVSNGANYIII